MPESHLASRRRRAIAFVIDMMAVMAFVSVSFGLGLVVPLDQQPAWATVIQIALVLVGVGYIFEGPAWLPNTIGRYATGIRVVDAASGNRPTASQAARRGATSGLWFVEAIVLATSATKQRLGDRWAHTKVISDATRDPRWKRAIPPLIVLGILFVFLMFATPYINANTKIGQAAQAYVAKELQVASSTPQYIEIVNSEGTVHLSVGDRCLLVILKRAEETWNATKVEEAPSCSQRGFSMRQGSMQTSASSEF